MFSLERWHEILNGLGKNKLRTFLTGVSVASGIFILVILLGAGNGIQNGIQKQFQKDAENRILVYPGTTKKEYKGHGIGRRIQFRNKDYQSIATLLDDYIEYKSAIYSSWSQNVVYKKETGNYNTLGVYPDNQFIENASIVSGRFINQSDIDNYEKIAVIGQKVANDLFLNEEDPIGKYLKIQGVIYKVVGIFSDQGDEREENRIFLPITTSQQVYSAGDKINYMCFTLKRRDNFEQTVIDANQFTKKLEQFLKSKHNIAPDDNGAPFVYNVIEEAKNVFLVTSGVKIFFWFVGLCTIIAGVVGVGNIMLIIVKERTKEIGIRKALGASPFSIISSILHEAVFITVVAGFVGLILGLLVWEIVGPFIETDFFTRPEVDFTVTISTLILLIVSGAFAGFIPAYRAAKIQPIVALRDE